jgi:autotransporter translocation and assembly factor TamB
MNIPFQSIETRWLRWLLRLSVALIILLGVLSLAAWLYLRSERFNNFVARRIERGAQDYGLRVEVGGFTPGWSARSVRLRDLRVHNQQTGQLIATIKEAELSTDIPNLFALSLERDVILKELRLSGVELQVVIDEQGKPTWPGCASRRRSPDAFTLMPRNWSRR